MYMYAFLCVVTVRDIQIDLKHINQTKGDNNKVELGIDLREFYPSVEWDILGVPAERHEKYYPCCAEPYPGKFKSLVPTTFVSLSFSLIHHFIHFIVCVCIFGRYNIMIDCECLANDVSEYLNNNTEYISTFQATRNRCAYVEYNF